VLLFDEPLSNLDAQLRMRMRVDIRQLQQSLGLTAIYVTHDQEEALAISDRIAVLRNGRIEQVGPPESIYQSPQTAFVAEFMGTTNMLAGVVGAFDGVTTSVAAGQTEILVHGRVAAPGGRVMLSIRPETLRLAAAGSDLPRLSARLQMREFLGSVVRLHLALADGTPIRVSVLSGDDNALQRDRQVELAYDPAQILTFVVP
jgi:ABC-type Fe3+/spermidine/putrescine transport system ATPase subunit